MNLEVINGFAQIYDFGDQVELLHLLEHLLEVCVLETDLLFSDLDYEFQTPRRNYLRIKFNHVRVVNFEHVEEARKPLEVYEVNVILLFSAVELDGQLSRDLDFRFKILHNYYGRR